MESLKRDVSQGYLFEEACEYKAEVEKQRDNSTGNISKTSLPQTTGFQQAIVAHEEISLEENVHNFNVFERTFDVRSKINPQHITYSEAKPPGHILILRNHRNKRLKEINHLPEIQRKGKSKK